MFVETIFSLILIRGCGYQEVHNLQHNFFQSSCVCIFLQTVKFKIYIVILSPIRTNYNSLKILFG